MKAAAILLGAGRGDRLGGEAKAFAWLGGRPLLAHALDAALACPQVSSVVIAAPPEHLEAARAVAGDRATSVVAGGAARQDSVRLALEAVPEGPDAVACHDVARPLASPALWSRVLVALAETEADGVVPVVPVSDTIKRVSGEDVRETVPREELRLAQTPQAFRRPLLLEAHEGARRQGFEATDDAALVEWIGGRVVAVPGDATNMKVTVAADLLVAAALLEESSAGR